MSQKAASQKQTSKKKVIHWFRQDLRLADNPALYEAAQAGTVLPVYILDDKNANDYAMGGASRVWLHHGLKNLHKDLDSKLSLYTGDALEVLNLLIEKYDIQEVYWNRCYEPWRIHRDKKIKSALQDRGIEVKTYNGSLLWEPWEISKSNDEPYRVFTPFYRKGCLNAAAPRTPLKKPSSLHCSRDATTSLNLNDLELIPEIKWHTSIEQHWNMSEAGALAQLKHFLENGIDDYKEGRNLPAQDNVSRLSPYLHFGQISPNQVWYAARELEQDKNVDHFCSELGWREFSYHLLYWNPALPEENLQKKFDRFPWNQETSALKAWQKGLTGIPMVDAGMRELWQTGYMHNRVRMITGSFLVKNMLLHWHHGESWFWDCLVDADLANNAASWQWIAGCGADAAPYFRIFNPVTQGHKFDPDGDYVRQYIPEIAKLPNKYLFSPWEAPAEVLKQAEITLGKTYPKPVADLKESREIALDAFKSLKETEK